MKEYLTKNSNGEYQLVNHRFSDDDIEVPDGAECLVTCGDDKGYIFYKGEFNLVLGIDDGWDFVDSTFKDFQKTWPRSRILWQRHTQQVDNVNHPSHYTQGGIECIEAIKASMTHEAFCGYLKGNVQKYMWRYEHKGGVESLKKAQWYLDRLVAERDSGEER